MIRLILREINPGAAINIGGPVEVEHRTMDVDLPDVEAWLTEPRRMNDHYTTRGIIGAEVLVKVEGAQ